MFKITIDKGANFLTELPKFFDKLRTSKAIQYAPWGIIGEYMIKHSKDGVSRGRLIQTFRKLGFDLSRFASNTERLPNAKAIDTAELAKGLREFILPEGTRIRLTAEIKDPNRMFADILNDRRSPMAEFLNTLLKASNLKSEGGKGGNVRKNNP